MKKKEYKLLDKIILFIQILFLVDIFLIQNIFKGIKVGTQDIAGAIGFFILFFNLNLISKMNLKSVFKNINIYILYLLIVNTILLIFNETEPRYIFYICKNMVYFLCFIITAVCLEKNSKLIKNIIKIFVSITVIYGFYLLLSNQISYYGIGTIFETVPSRSGNIYFIGGIISLFFYNEDKDNKFLILFLLNIILTVATISKSNILGISIFILVSFTLKTISSIKHNKIDIRILLRISLILLIIFLLLIMFNNIEYKFNNIFIQKIKLRFGAIGDSYKFRKNKGIDYLKYFFEDRGIFSYLFGVGKGITEIKLNISTMGVDNQYIRSVIEIGIVGILLWLRIIKSIYIKMLNKRKIFFISFFIAYLFMGIGYEVFVVTKSAIIFWFVLGVILKYES